MIAGHAGPAPRPSIDHVRAALAPDEAVVGWLEYHLSDAMYGSGGRFSLWGYVITRDGGLHWKKLQESDDRTVEETWYRGRGDAVEAIHHASRWPFRVDRDPDLDASAQHAWSVLFEPLAPYLEGVSRIVVPMNRLVSGLPVECLIDDRGRTIDETFTVHYVTSTAMLTRRARSGG